MCHYGDDNITPDFHQKSIFKGEKGSYFTSIIMTDPVYVERNQIFVKCENLNSIEANKE